MWYDADIDAVMTRIAMRSIPRGRVSRIEALVFGFILAGSASCRRRRRHAWRARLHDRIISGHSPHGDVILDG
jgi:hypothetical protein